MKRKSRHFLKRIRFQEVHTLSVIAERASESTFCLTQGKRANKERHLFPVQQLRSALVTLIPQCFGFALACAPVHTYVHTHTHETLRHFYINVTTFYQMDSWHIKRGNDNSKTC